MAGLSVSYSSPQITLVANTAKTIYQIVAPANQRVLIFRWLVSFYDTNYADGTATIVVMRQTSAGTMSSASLVKRDPSAAETIQSTAFYNASVEPTAGSVLDTQGCNVTGNIVIPYNPPIVIPGGGRLGIQVTSPINTTCTITVYQDE